MLLLVVVVRASGTLGACTILYGPPAEEFSRGDGGSSRSAGASGGGTSGTLPDGGPIGEGGASSGTASSGGMGAPFVCPNAPLSCDDFEGPPTVLKPTGNADGLAVVEGGHGSGKALAVTFKNGKVAMYEAVFTDRPHVELSLWIRVDGPPPSGPEIHFRVASLLFGDACDWELSWQIWIDTNGLHQGADVYDAGKNPSCGPVKFTSKPIFTASELFDKKWHHILVDADASQRIRRTSVVADALPAVTEELDSERGKVPSSLQVDVGVPCVQETSGCSDWQGPP